MASELETWERPHFEDGGGDPQLFYVLYGKFDPTVPLSRSKYRADGIPDGIGMMSYGPDKHPDVPKSFMEGYLWDEFVEQEPQLSAEVAKCEYCMAIRGTPNDSTNLNYLRNTIGLIAYLMDQGGLAIYDPFMFRWWNYADWKESIFEPAAPEPREHTVILISEEDDPSLRWYHTRGMLKFGRPDISVHNVPVELHDPIVDLCNRLIEHQAFGHVVANGQEVKMSTLPGGGKIFHAGSLDDPEFNNVHIDVQLGHDA